MPDAKAKANSLASRPEDKDMVLEKISCVKDRFSSWLFLAETFMINFKIEILLRLLQSFKISSPEKALAVSDV